MTKPYEWQMDARDLMAGRYLIPKGARIFRYRVYAERAMSQVRANDPTLICRIWQCPGGWVVVNALYEALGLTRGTVRHVWYALIPHEHRETA